MFEQHTLLPPQQTTNRNNGRDKKIFVWDMPARISFSSPSIDSSRKFPKVWIYMTSHLCHSHRHWWRCPFVSVTYDGLISLQSAHAYPCLSGWLSENILICCNLFIVYKAYLSFLICHFEWKIFLDCRE